LISLPVALSQEKKDVKILKNGKDGDVPQGDTEKGDRPLFLGLSLLVIIFKKNRDYPPFFEKRGLSPFSSECGFLSAGCLRRRICLESLLFYEQEVKNDKKDEEDEEIIFFAQNTEFEFWFNGGAICERLQPWNESSSMGAVFFIHGSELIS
jgi:hypothetical protein